ncbi:TPA: hypothetical protein EYP66_10365 [Candidatus Poribacteria bacterium]|nr:hypothetical protein [Candidatus Poribacteria bacterium]
MMKEDNAMEEKPIITPSQFLTLEGITSEDNQCTVAIVAFCPFHEMKDKARARSLDKSLFVHIDLSHQFHGFANGRQFLMVDCVYGGPVCATVIEEMAYLGVKHVIGYGYSGSLRKEIMPGSIVLALSAIVSDGTSREYSEASEVKASAVLLSKFDKLDVSLRNRVFSGKAWTTDAIYREYPSKIQSWLKAGADLVNMDTSHFCAVSQAVGIEALYFSLISDYVGEKNGSNSS